MTTIGSETAHRSPATLVVLFHGWHGSQHGMEHVIAATRAALAPLGGVCVHAPDLAYRSYRSFTRVATMLMEQLTAIDAIVERGAYERIVFVGHSMGGVLARRLFLLAAGSPPGFRCEAEFAGVAPRPWAARVERHVTLGSFNRGWVSSQRDGWINSFFYNAMGLTGHLTANSNGGPTIFDLRLGSPFMVQTRLHWLAFRRWHRRLRAGDVSESDAALPASRARDPLVVQVLGNGDDLTSPLNQVDLAIDRPDYAAAPDTQRDIYLEMKNTTHNQAIDFGNAEEGARRRAVFVAALTGSPGEFLAMRDALSDPTLLVDDLPAVDTSVTAGVFVMHGIRDDGYWTCRLAKRVKERAPHGHVLRTRTPTYGYFAMLPFLMPWIRRQKVEWFMDQYVEARALFPRAKLSFIGHSNGTYLAASALRDYADAEFENVFLAGSVVRRSYGWRSLAMSGRVARVHNVRAAYDWVVALLPKSIETTRLDLGGAGWDGFDDVGSHPAITQARQFANGQHGAALVESQWDNIVDFILAGRVPEETPAKDFAPKQPWWLRAMAASHVFLPVLVLIALVVVPLLILYVMGTIGRLLGCPSSPLTAGMAVTYTLALTAYFAALKFIVTRV